MKPFQVATSINAYCRSRHGLLEVWFHGSRFRGDNRPDSDIDLYFEFDSAILPTEWSVLFDLEPELERLKSDLQPLFGFQVHPTFAHYEIATWGLRKAARTGALVYCKAGWEPQSASGDS